MILFILNYQSRILLTIGYIGVNILKTLRGLLCQKIQLGFIYIEKKWLLIIFSMHRQILWYLLVHTHLKITIRVTYMP